MNKKNPVLYILLCASLCLSIFAVAAIYTPGKQQTQKYTLYVGTNDKHTLAPVMELEEAMELVKDVCMEHVEGFTLTTGKGAWVNAQGGRTEEDTIILTFFDVSETQVSAIMDELLVKLNQESILLETQAVGVAYYPSY